MKFAESRQFALAAALSLVALCAGAQQPPDVVQSDNGTRQDTAMGTDALASLDLSTGAEGNTAAGFGALTANYGGSSNTAVGDEAIFQNTTGSNNTGVGTLALAGNSTGSNNTALGANSLFDSDTASNNTAVGYSALGFLGTPGSDNTAVGANALLHTSGSDNTAVGSGALQLSTTGSQNTAVGQTALYNNTTGRYNVASGFAALYNNNAGTENTADGTGALYSNTDGKNNTAVGINALFYTTTVSNNIALGYEAGYNIKTGGNNIEIGNRGAAGDAKVIKIGTESTQTKTFIAGIYNTSVAGSPVMVDSSGQLGMVVSSERFKTDIATMGAGTAKLAQLRPVTFKLKTDAQGTVQYGLIAEEVAKVYPELVIRDASGRIDGVRYDELAPMLLNEVQKDHATVATLVAQHEADTVKLDSQAAKIASLEQQLAGIQTALVKLQPNDQFVAQR